MSYVANGTANINSVTDKRIDMFNSALCPMENVNWLIHLLHVRGQKDLCKNIITVEINDSNGCNEFAYYKQAIILRQEGAVQQALEYFQLCHKLNSKDVVHMKEIGRCLYLLKRYRLALDAYLEAEGNGEISDWNIYHNIGECYNKLGDTVRTKEYIQRAVQLGKEEKSYAMLIRILSTEGDLRSAVAVANGAVESCPESVALLTECGILYLKLGQTQHAFERLSSALALEPSSPKALLAIGCITQNHEEHDVALSKYKIAVQTYNNSVALWNNIGICFYSKQKYIAAVTCLKRALWYSPLNWRVLLNLSMLHLATQQYASSFNFACAAVNIRSDVSLAFTMLGCSLLELKDTENGLKALQQASSLATDDPSVIVNLAVCLYQCGNFNKSSEFLRNCMPQISDNAYFNTELRAMCERLQNLLPTVVHEDDTITEPNTSPHQHTLERNEDERNVAEIQHVEDNNPTEERHFAPDEV